MHRIFILVSALALVSCGNVPGPSDNFQVFSGLVQPGSSWGEKFSMRCSGYCEYSYALTTVTPDNQARLGIGVFNYTGSCSFLVPAATLNVTTASSINFPGQLPSGDYCIIVQDVGYLQRVETVTVKVTHP